MERNRFLVIVRAGDDSLHPRWTDDSLSRRDWDLVVSYFGNDPQRFRGPGESRIDDAGPKWKGLHALLSRDRFWQEYQYVWLPDDDLMADQQTVSDFFSQASALNLQLSQPSLSWVSYYAHPVTVRHRSFRYRITNFVEIMAPCFHTEFLSTCLSTFPENLSGWGLDWLWPRLLPPGGRCGIVDTAEVTHTRPIGGPSYRFTDRTGTTAEEEMNRLKAKFGIPLDDEPRTLSGVDRMGRILQGPELRAALDRDWQDFQEYGSMRQGGSNAPAIDLKHDG
ncbi:MAG: DUF707 domain-containing protein [Acidobacteriota bacterium]